MLPTGTLACQFLQSSHLKKKKKKLKMCCLAQHLHSDFREREKKQKNCSALCDQPKEKHSHPLDQMCYFDMATSVTT